MKTDQITLGYFLTFSGNSGTIQLRIPRKGRIQWIDWNFAAQVSEIAAADRNAEVALFRGTAPGSFAASTQYNNLIGGVTAIFRSNATFAVNQSMQKFQGPNLDLMVSAFELFELQYLMSAACTVRGTITLCID